MFPLHRPSHEAPLLSSFVHQSTLSSIPHDPLVDLASHTIRTAFGETVQIVSDALQSRGPLTWKSLVIYIHTKSRKKPVLSHASIRAALLVLVQHSLCSIKLSSGINPRLGNQATYTFLPDRAIVILHYARYIEWMKKAYDLTAACCVETLLLAGRLRTVDLVVQAADHAPKSDRYTVRQSVVEALYKLVNSGFLERVPELKSPVPDDHDDQEEHEFDEPPKKKVKIEDPPSLLAAVNDEDPAVIGLLHAHANYRAALPVDAVWRVNLVAFHESLRALTLGKLVLERYGSKVQSAGSLVTAALRYRIHRRFSAQFREAEPAAFFENSFSPQDTVKFLPKPVLQNLEKKVGGVAMNLSKAWKALSEQYTPEVAGRLSEDRYEILVSSLLDYLRTRATHQLIYDRHGEVAARVVAILSRQGWLESDVLAEQAMVPAKDTREILHTLYRSGYVDLFQLGTSRQYNPASTIYLWRVDKDRLLRKVKENVMLALWRIRLRRQHQAEVGKEWISRAQQAEADENDNETDKLNYQQFCLGLERLDQAVLNLDETLMLLHDP